MSDIDLFDLFNIEHQDNILDIFNDVKLYCSNNHLILNIDRKYGDFFNFIYNNIDVEQSSEFINKYINNEIEETLIYDEDDMNILEIDEYY